VPRFVVADLHAGVDHVAHQVGDHLLALAVFIFTRRKIVAAQQFLVGVEIELAVALKCGRGRDLMLQRFVADTDSEMARLITYQLPFDQPVERFLADIDVLHHRRRVGPVHLLQDLAEVSGLAIDLDAKDLIPIDAGDGVDSIEHPYAKTPEGHDQGEHGEGNFYLP